MEMPSQRRTTSYNKVDLAGGVVDVRSSRFSSGATRAVWSILGQYHQMNGMQSEEWSRSKHWGIPLLEIRSTE